MNNVLKKSHYLSASPEASQRDGSESGMRTISAPEKIAYILLFALLVTVRIPAVLNGRLWAEEGSVFFLNAWNFPWEKALWISYGGYLNISANLASILARHFVPLEKACYVTSFFGLIVQTYPVILLCMSGQKWLQERKTLIAGMLIIATLPLSQEVWLSSIGSQCHLSLCTALILVLEPFSGAKGLFQKFILLVAPLSGPGAALLLPLFVLRMWIDKSKARLIQTSILAAAAITQFAFFWRPAERLTVGNVPTQVLGIDPGLLLNVFFVKHLLGPFFGMTTTADITHGWGTAYASGQLVSPQSMIFAGIVLLAFVFSVWRCRSVESKWLFLSGALLFVMGNFGALGIRAALLNVTDCERYVFAPQVLFELSILAMIFKASGWRKTFAVGLITWLLIIAAHEYFWTPPFFSEGTAWRKEVHAWRHDHSYKLQIWPRGWSLTLKEPRD